MTLYPVILCGGGGTRLWPASRPSRPKQFIPLSGNRSLFQDAVLRMAPLCEGCCRVVVIGGLAHRAMILDQLAEIDVRAQVLLEPQPRDSAPAMAAAAAWILRENPLGVAAFVASDHYVPDHEAFRDAVQLAAAAAAFEGRIVTLGVRPDSPSSAYGYIRPSGPALSAVEAFIEKPERATAADYIEAGYLWNSGNFMVSAQTLLDQLSKHAPGVAAAAYACLPAGADGGAIVLTPAFNAAPKISIDYAVMEKTELASVLAVDFVWSDMGAWDAIAASGEGDVGSHIFEDAEGCVVRAPDDVLVAALGVRNLAIVVERDAVLIADLTRSQDVRRVVERVGISSPRHLDFETRPLTPIVAGARNFADWLRLRALPLWVTMGLGAQGFVEALSIDARGLEIPSRSLVQARQTYVYAAAGRLGWAGPWRDAVVTGLGVLSTRFSRDDGSVRAVIGSDGAIIDDTVRLYDQAFVILALAAAHAAGVDREGAERDAARRRDALAALAHPQRGFREADAHPFQANAQMHLFEASMAWEAISPDPAWEQLSDQIAGLALSCFIDQRSGMLREFFDEHWAPAAGEDGRLIEPGHQFEWAWLLTRYSLARGRADALQAARLLYAVGRAGVGERSGVAQDALNDDGSIRSARARLWPQAEWLKAALLLAEQSRDADRAALLADAAAALRALWSYLTPHGLWRDKRLPDGQFVDEAVPASSFYHIMAAFEQLAGVAGTPGIEELVSLDLR